MSLREFWLISLIDFLADQHNSYYYNERSYNLRLPCTRRTICPLIVNYITLCSLCILSLQTICVFRQAFVKTTSFHPNRHSDHLASRLVFHVSREAIYVLIARRIPRLHIPRLPQIFRQPGYSVFHIDYRSNINLAFSSQIITNITKHHKASCYEPQLCICLLTTNHITNCSITIQYNTFTIFETIMKAIYHVII